MREQINQFPTNLTLAQNSLLLLNRFVDVCSLSKVLTFKASQLLSLHMLTGHQQPYTSQSEQPDMRSAHKAGRTLSLPLKVRPHFCKGIQL